MKDFIFRGWHSGVMYGPFQIGSQLSMEAYNCIEQYTGLKDKNDKAIYEGDIVRWSTGNEYIIVYWENFCSFMRYDQTNDTYWDLAQNNHRVEIVGNIHHQTGKINQLARKTNKMVKNTLTAVKLCTITVYNDGSPDTNEAR